MKDKETRIAEYKKELESTKEMIATLESRLQDNVDEYGRADKDTKIFIENDNSEISAQLRLLKRTYDRLTYRINTAK